MNLDFATTAFLANMALAEAPSMDTLTPDETRLAFSEIYKSMPPGPEDVASETLEVPVDGGSIDCRILRPSGTAKSVIIYYHGGGLRGISRCIATFTEIDWFDFRHSFVND